MQPKATPAPIPAPSVQKPAAAPLAQPKAAPAQPVEKKAEVIQPESEKKPEPEMDERTRRFIEMLERNFTRDDRDRSDRSR